MTHSDEATSPLLDLALMESIANNINHAVFAEMLDGFVSNLKTYAGDITSAIDLGDAKAAKRAAHALRGVAGQMGAARLSQVAKTIETSAAENAFPEAVIVQLDETANATAAAIMAWRERLNAHSSIAAK